MKPFVDFEAVAAPLDTPKVDTDQILPARFLRRPRKEGYGRYLFHDLRFREDGQEIPEFVLNRGPFREAQILVADRNFGGGSSREQAPWGLADYGIRCVIASDFGEIFHSNALKTGVLPVVLDIETCMNLRARLHATPGARMRVSLSDQTVCGPDGSIHRFEIDAFRKRCLMQGLDDIGITLQHEAAIASFEAQRRQQFAWLYR